MKRNYLFTAYLALYAFLLVSCEKDPAAGLAKSRTMMISATIPIPVEEGKALWLEGDTIKIFSNRDFTGHSFIAKTSGSTKISFTGPVTEGEQFYGTYPDFLQGSFDGSIFSVEMPEQQPTSFWPMVGKGTREDGLEFKGTGALLSVNMTGQGNVSSVKIEGKDAEGNPLLLSGTARVDMNATFPTLQMISGGNTYVERTVDVSLTSEVKKVYILIPPGSYQSLAVTLTSAIGETFFQETSSVNLSSEQILNVDLLVDFEEIAEPIEANLSLAGLANCYVVPVGGNYFFDAKLTDNTVLNGDGADLLWADVAYNWINDNAEVQNAVSPIDPEYIIKDISYDAQEGRISFTATGNVGNATIALYTESGGTRSIVWTWHVWVAGRSLNQMRLDWVSKNLSAKGQSLVWLDRNIGAINDRADNIGAYGLLYQWGRKDPFIGSRIIGQKANPSGTDEGEAFGDLTLPIYANSAFGNEFRVETSLGSVQDVVKNPMVFYASSGNWAMDIPASAWGDGVAPFATWQGYMRGDDPSANYTDGIRSGSKSIYDPCPSGYRVPTSEEMWLSFAAWSHADYPAWAGNVTSTIAANTNSHLVTAYNDLSSVVLFPAFGHRDAGKLDALGSAGYYHTATINPANASQAFRQLVGSNMRVEGSGTFAFARPVRCVVE
ncbi:hypothetical protein FXV77_04095 [Sphingobacterium phlebotomi]|uniref:Fibrobacter succinogenes major paralogous domain-containing protein n=1 Tax=Sphingobacterium phlebotomi TaxID=2605433 RepID=A0A5D4HCS9_9SPHI|nr:hypothetical protein [Sphingobacterium phlebotomi]TYR38467.1 hypothetical protein FXV77_04095 [Sphingobacterium phlebotomi]